jgi:hypothetical protein
MPIELIDHDQEIGNLEICKINEKDFDWRMVVAGGRTRKCKFWRRHSLFEEKRIKQISQFFN